MRHRKQSIPELAWSSNLVATFESLKQLITSLPLLARYDSTKPLFLKIDWNATGMGYTLMQPDNRAASRIALEKLLSTGECDFDILQSGARLQPILFNRCTCREIKHHYHGVLGKLHVVDGLWPWRNGIYGDHIFWYAIWLQPIRSSTI